MTETKVAGDDRLPPAMPVNSAFWLDFRFWILMLAGLPVWGVLSVLLPVSLSSERIWPGPRTWIVSVVLAPVLEELVFRGLLQGWLLQYHSGRKRLGPVSLANLGTAIVFAAFHLWSQPLQWAAVIVLPALVFGWARDRYGSVLPGMALHAFYNAGFVALFVSD